MPLEFFPASVRTFIDHLPFRQMLAFPVENLLGLMPRSASLRDLALQWAWVVVFTLTLRLSWTSGMKRFGAYGG